ncbi:hypothetical protein MIR68_001899 [Amoeboaphelidium protococcarum]|nr:hypothetical protein MIR68_001899 [Amoeboaphelidium protococcarum]
MRVNVNSKNKQNSSAASSKRTSYADDGHSGASDSPPLSASPVDDSRLGSPTGQTYSQITDDDTVKVVIRIRPLNQLESQRNDGQAVFQLPDGQTITAKSTDGKPTPSLRFNHVFGSETNQKEFFDSCGVKVLIEKAVQGYNSCVFAYGQTSSGKTHSLTGPDEVDFSQFEQEHWGLIPRSLFYMFEYMDQLDTEEEFTIKASYLEIYNEHVQDLLNPSAASLPVRYNKENGFFVENLFEVECDVLDDCMAVLEEGLRNRKVGSHKLNERSSRSHSMLTLIIQSETVDPDDGRFIRKIGKINFVDLAGSERVKESKATGQMFNESLSINKSLLCLGNCISALAEMKRKKSQAHVPYRDSKLTKLLFETLGGNGLALMIACVSPSSVNLNETLNTLRYASRARKIQNKPVLQMDPREELILNLRKQIQQLKVDNDTLSGLVDSFTARESEQADKSLLEKQLNEAHEAISHYLEENKALSKQKDEIYSDKEKMSRENKNLLEENDRLIAKIESLVQVFGSQLDDEIAKTAAALDSLNQQDVLNQSKGSSQKFGGGGNVRLGFLARRQNDQQLAQLESQQKLSELTVQQKESLLNMKRLLATTLTNTKKKEEKVANNRLSLDVLSDQYDMGAKNIPITIIDSSKRRPSFRAPSTLDEPKKVSDSK